MKKIACLVTVFFLCSSLTVPTLSYADDCSDCCAYVDETADFQFMPLMQCYACECGFPCDCLAGVYGAGWLCLSFMWESTTIPIAVVGCLGYVNLLFERCQQIYMERVLAQCPCPDGCP